LLLLMLLLLRLLMLLLLMLMLLLLQQKLLLLMLLLLLLMLLLLLLLLHLLVLLLQLLQMLLILLLLQKQMLLKIVERTTVLVAQTPQLMFHLLESHGRRLSSQPRDLRAELFDNTVLGFDIFPQHQICRFQLLQLRPRCSALLLRVTQLLLQRPQLTEGGGVGLLIKCYSYSHCEQLTAHLHARTQNRDDGF
jgi:hypothetical protein